MYYISLDRVQVYLENFTSKLQTILNLQAMDWHMYYITLSEINFGKLSLNLL